MLTNRNFLEIKKYVKSHTEQELQINAFREYLSNQEISWNESDSLEHLAKIFDQREFPEFSANSDYFIQSIRAIKRNFGKFCKLEELLKSAESKEIFLCLLRAKLCIDIKSLQQAFRPLKTQYFRTEYFTFEPDEIYVDCGAYTGDTILEFIHYAPDYHRIYAFEASKYIKDRLESPFGTDGSIIFLNKAVGDVTGEKISFSDQTGKGDGIISPDGKDWVETVRLDDVISEQVTFIKMDVEGYEIPAINGAKRIIANDTPKMAICIYHKENDFWEIPELILSINPNYEFEIGQYRAYEFWDTILYCIPKKGKTEFPHSKMISEEKIAERTNLLRLKTSMIQQDEYDFLNLKYEEATWLKRELGKNKRYSKKLEQQINELNQKNEELVMWGSNNKNQIEELLKKNEELAMWGSNSKNQIETLMKKNQELFDWAKSLEMKDVK